MYPYEAMFLVDPVAHTADPEAVEKVVRDLLEKHGAAIEQFERWDERKLAYEIKGHKRGVYLLIHFKMAGENIDPLRGEVRITEVILRQTIFRLETDIAAHLERTAAYYDKVRERDEERREREDGEAAPPRRPRREEGGETTGETPPAETASA